MERIRKPFQGVTNIVRFNRHFYLLACAIIIFFLLLNPHLKQPYRFYIDITCLLITATTFISLIVSFYIYDVSNLYRLDWLDKFDIESNHKIININAGFDETSILLHNKYPNCELQVFDFYDPIKHTEVSIKRARKAYSAYTNTLAISTFNLPLEDNYADEIFLTLAAHEIRNDAERIVFFNELYRVVKPLGKIIITEHVRDLPNFLAYNIGFFHFIAKLKWLQTFKTANLKIIKIIKTTPFITTFVLIKNGNTP